MSSTPAASETTTRFDNVAALIEKLEHQVEDLFELSALGAYTTDSDGHCLSINSQALKWIGCNSDSILGKKNPALPRALLNWEILKRGSELLNDQGLNEIELSLFDESSRQRYFLMVTTPAQTSAGPAGIRRALFHDITEKKRYLERQRISAMAFDSRMGICVTDQDWKVLEVNAAFSKITGYSSADLRTNSFDVFLSTEIDVAKKQEIRQSLVAHDQWEGEIRARMKKGGSFTGWLNISAVPVTNSSKRYYVACLYDITERKATQEEIHRLAFFDPLTELPNRRRLNDRLTRMLSVIPRSHLLGALLFIDLDKFKAINDTKGHAVGDELLIEVALRLQRAIRDVDMVARVGGDEFVVLLGDLSANIDEASYQVNVIGTKILRSLAIPYQLENCVFTCSASIGIAMFNHDGRAEEVLQHADMAMYRAKKEGGNALSFFDPAMKDAASAYSNLEQDLRQVIDLNQLELFFQPQFDVLGRVVSAEGLLRWHHASRGLIGPNEFISIAEESGMIVPIGLWVIQAACDQIKRWDSDPILSHLQLSINVSTRQFHDQDFVKKIAEIINKTGINPARLKLELTESMMHNLDEIRSKMQKISELGVRFSLDDFGIGYSSLASLIKLPIEELKIDRSFVANMLSSPSDGIVVKTIIAMARSLSLEVIAEGLETENEKDFLYANGCLLYQGYLMSPPLPQAEFEAFTISKIQVSAKSQATVGT
jgi:diguanylate cyclase (GGDEF)-like protein/PAS domain S-box-containing protein